MILNGAFGNGACDWNGSVLGHGCHEKWDKVATGMGLIPRRSFSGTSRSGTCFRNSALARAMRTRIAVHFSGIIGVNHP